MALAVCSLVTTVTMAGAAEFFVAPAGTANGDGSTAKPWNLQTALAHPKSVQPGDTIWLRGGTYKGAWTSKLKGAPGAPITVRQYPGERAILDANGASASAHTVTIEGAWSTWWGFEVTNSHPDRKLARPGAFNVFGPNTRLINLIIHDAGSGVYMWVPAENSEVYGCLIYNIGWEPDNDRAHGHSMYVQNRTGIMRMVDNLMFNGLSFGIQAYGSEAAYLNNFYMEGNTAANHGTFSANSGAKANFLIGGGRTAENPTFINNYSYYNRGTYGGRAADIGYTNYGAINATIKDNYLVSHMPLTLKNAETGLILTGNALYSDYGKVATGMPSGYATKYPHNTYQAKRPTGVQTYVRPNRYESGRANVTVFNWDRKATVEVDLSSALKVGDRYEIRNAQALFDPAVVSGTYDGRPVALPMTGLGVAKPIGGFRTGPTPTDPEFNAFIVLPLGAGTPAPAAPDLAVAVSDSPDPAQVDGQLRYTVTITNQGAGAASGVQLTNSLPDSVVLESVSTSQGSYSSAGQTVYGYLGNLASGASATVTITVRPTATGTITNTATVLGNEADLNEANNTATQSTTIVKSTTTPTPVPPAPTPVPPAPTPVPTNAPPTVSLTAPTANASFTAPASIGLTATAADSDGTVQRVAFYLETTLLGTDLQAPYQFAWNNVAAGTYQVTAVATDDKGEETTSSPLTITVNAPAPPPEPTPAPIPTPTPAPVSKANLWIGQGTATYYGTVGQPLTYQIKLVNYGPHTATGVRVVDTLPQGGSFVSATASQGTWSRNNGTVTFQPGELTSGAAATFTVVITLAVKGTITNRVQVSGAETDPYPSNNTSTRSTTVLAGKAQPAPTPTNAPPTVSVTAESTNARLAVTAATNASYTAPASVTLTAEAADRDGTVDEVAFYQGTTLLGRATQAPYQFTWNNVAAGTYQVTAIATDDRGARTTSEALTITVNAPTVTPEPTPVPVGKANLWIGQGTATYNGAVGQPLTYQIKLVNYGPHTATAVRVVDTLPPGVSFVSATASQGTWNWSNGVVTFNPGSLTSGAAAIFTVVVKPAAKGTITNRVQVSGAETDPYPSNNTSSRSTGIY